MELKIAFGKTLKSLRVEKGFTQEKLAELSNLDVTFISKMENGKLQPSLTTIFSISKALGVQASYLIERIEKLG
ncbi:MAG: helix-turn-helix transcriptional regulator [Bacteroidetes bacterium]|nr:helix-turn-helix transcriptional regulator [Bacteroidota bacterium]